jgi:hypothetical protein
MAVHLRDTPESMAACDPDRVVDLPSRQAEASGESRQLVLFDVHSDLSETATPARESSGERRDGETHNDDATHAARD